jgi:integrase
LTEAEYRTLGKILREAAEDDKYQMTVDIIRQIALTWCRRAEMIKLQWVEPDTDASCLRLTDSKEGASTRPIGLPVVEYLESRRTELAARELREIKSTLPLPPRRAFRELRNW